MSSYSVREGWDLPILGAAKVAPRRSIIRLSLFAVMLLASAGAYAASWTALKNLAPSAVELMVQETDGTLLVHSYDGQTWMKLTPDATGNYINGTWTLLASAPLARLYFASQILPDGRFFDTGGEYAGPGLYAFWANTGEIYDPVANAWTVITPYPNQTCFGLNYVSGNVTSGSTHITNIYPYTSGLVVGWTVSGAGIPAGSTIVSVDSPTQITISASSTATHTAEQVSFNHSYQLTGCVGDEPSILLPGSEVLVGDLVNPHTFIYSPSTNTWTESGSKVYSNESSDEEGWNKLGNGSVLTYDIYQSFATGGSYAEVYNPTSGTWASISPSDGTAAGTIPELSGTAIGFELGPQLRLQDGRALVVGATQHTALYNPSTNTWAAGPDTSGTLNGIASPFGGDDAPGAILPNGHVIFAADAGASQFASTGDTTAGSNIITNIPSTAIMQAGWPISDGNNAIPAGSKITSVDSPSQIHISNDATKTLVNDPFKFSSGNITSGSNIITNIPYTAIFQVFWPVTGSGIPSNTYITSVDSPTQVHISANATATIANDPIQFGGTYSNPTQLFDFNPTTNTISPISPAIPDGNLPSMGAYPTRMLVLPTGQALFSDGSTQVWAYTPDGTASPALRPAISGFTFTGTPGVFTLTGTQLNGQSAGAAYGDDDMMDSNYPIVRLQNAAGNVYYCKTTNWSSTGVDGGTTPETVTVTLNPAITPGNYLMIVSGAGIQSFPVAVNITAAQI